MELVMSWEAEREHARSLGKELEVAESRPKTAAELAARLYARAGDDYAEKILVGARALVASGMGEAVYHTQWASGNTHWYLSDRAYTVTPAGEITSVFVGEGR
jgi:hypothetical protein